MLTREQAAQLFNEKLFECMKWLQTSPRFSHYFPWHSEETNIGGTTSPYFETTQKAYVLREGSKASEAIGDLFNPDSQTYLTTSSKDSVTLALYGALLHSLRVACEDISQANDFFDQLFPTLILVQHLAPSDKTENHPTALKHFMQRTKSSMFQEKGSIGKRPTQPGDVVRFRNTPDYTSKHPKSAFHDQTAICVAPNAYRSFGISNPEIASEADICEFLEEKYLADPVIINVAFKKSNRIVETYDPNTYCINIPLLTDFLNDPKRSIEEFCAYQRDDKEFHDQLHEDKKSPNFQSTGLVPSKLFGKKKTAHEPFQILKTQIEHNLKSGKAQLKIILSSHRPSSNRKFEKDPLILEQINDTYRFLRMALLASYAFEELLKKTITTDTDSLKKNTDAIAFYRTTRTEIWGHLASVCECLDKPLMAYRMMENACNTFLEGLSTDTKLPKEYLALCERKERYLSNATVLTDNLLNLAPEDSATKRARPAFNT